MRIPGVTVFARFKSRPGQENAVRRALLDMIEPTIQENGNIGYALHTANDDPTLFLLYEQWNDATALDTHMKQNYFAEMEQRLLDILQSPMEVITAQMIGGETAPTAAGTATSA